MTDDQAPAALPPIVVPHTELSPEALTGVIEAFVLRDLDGLETPEVARALEITESSVRSLVTLARRRLRELLGARLARGNP